MRCAILKLALETPIGLVLLLSLAIQETTERRLSDHPSRTAASRTRGQNEMPAWVHREAVPRNEFLRDSTEAKMLARSEGSGREEPSRRALEMEKSQASWPPLGPRGTQTSAGRREEVEGSGGSGSGGRSSSTGSRGIKRPGFSRTVARLAPWLATE